MQDLRCDIITILSVLPHIMDSDRYVILYLGSHMTIAWLYHVLVSFKSPGIRYVCSRLATSNHPDYKLRYLSLNVLVSDHFYPLSVKLSIQFVLFFGWHVVRIHLIV